MIGDLKNHIHLATQELKLVGSPSDLRILSRKVRYLAPRILKFRHKASRIPPSLQLEPTNICNLRCISCPSDRSSRKKGYMEMGLFKKIINEAASIGVERIHLYLHGEPFLHAEIAEMLSYIKKKSLSVHLTTNGSAIGEAKIKDIMDSGLDIGDHIIFSILGNSKESHERIMKGVKHEQVLADIEQFVFMRRRLKMHGPVFEAILYTMDENRHEVDDFQASWNKRVDHARIARASNSVARYKAAQGLELQRNRTCPQIWERLTIYWNGDATICCGDFDGDYIMGSVRNSSLEALWNHEKLQQVRDCHSRGKFAEMPICQYCDM
ncbi:MAG: SPASM domain-containing protein [Acidobacteria bacterium]|nr:SPASM domain-containing protein [Acidobacteriota bacterium]